MKSLVFLFQYLKNTKKAFQSTLKLPTANFRWNNCTNQIIYVGSHVSLFSSLFHHFSSKWNSLPLYLRDTSISLHIFESLRKHLTLENSPVPIHTSHTWRDFRLGGCKWVEFFWSKGLRSKLLIELQGSKGMRSNFIVFLYGSVASLPSTSSNIEAWPYGTSLRFAPAFRALRVGEHI